MTKKSNTHPHLQSTTNGLPRMRTHPKTYQQCPETFLFDVSSPLSPMCTLSVSDSAVQITLLLSDSLMFTNLFSNFLPSAWTWKISVQGSSRTSIWGVKSCSRGQGATAGTAKHFTELPDCHSELRLGWWCTRLVLGHPNALDRCWFFLSSRCAI